MLTGSNRRCRTGGGFAPDRRRHLADDRSGAVSMTGEGEAIIRSGLAREICLLMEQGFSPATAGRRALKRIRRRTNSSCRGDHSAQGWNVRHSAHDTGDDCGTSSR